MQDESFLDVKDNFQHIPASPFTNHLFLFSLQKALISAFKKFAEGSLSQTYPQRHWFHFNCKTHFQLPPAGAGGSFDWSQTVLGGAVGSSVGGGGVQSSDAAFPFFKNQADGSVLVKDPMLHSVCVAI